MKKDKNSGKDTQNGNDQEKGSNVSPLNAPNASNKPGTERDRKSIFNVQRFFAKKVDFSILMDLKETLDNTSQSKPELKINISLNNVSLPNDAYEVDLLVTASATRDQKPVFTGSVEEAGIFTVKDFSKEELDFILKGYCPTLLFPFVRENIANLMMRAGCTPFELPVIDFINIYQRSLNNTQTSQTPQAPQ